MNVCTILRQLGLRTKKKSLMHNFMPFSNAELLNNTTWMFVQIYANLTLVQKEDKRLIIKSFLQT